MSMIYFVVVDPLLILLLLYRTISDNVSYLTMKTLKARVVFFSRIFPPSLDSSGRLRLLEVSSLEVRLNYSYLGVSF